MNTIIETEQQYTSGVYGKRPVAIVRGQHATLWDAEGNAYIDCVAGQGVANIGHGRPEIASVLAAQAQQLITCPEIFYNDVRSRLLQRLASLVPVEHARIFLCNSGTESVEGAFKFARLATGRTGIIAAMRAFHGRTMGSLSATWEPHYREPFAPLVPDITHMRYNDLTSAEAAINEHTAAVIIELVQGEGGVHVADYDYIQALAALCHQRGALLIIDEIQTGFGRTGTLFACEQYNIQPDILCLAKSLGGGIPIGAICLGLRVTESGHISKGVHGTTFGGNPLACASALATLDVIERENLPLRAATLGAYMLDRLRSIDSPLIRQVRGRGLLIGIELARRVQPYLEALLARGILALPAGPNVLRLLPPLVITQEQLGQVADAIEAILTPLSHHTQPVQPMVANQQTRQQREVSLLQQIVTIPSLSYQESTLAHYLVQQSRSLGLYAYVDEVGNFVASTHETIGDAQPVVLLGHMDTVPGNIPVRLDGDMLYGRGTVDAKGPLAAFVCATARLAQNHGSTIPIIVVGAIEEEAATSRGARAIIDRYRPSACIIGEPSGSQSITIGYKGRLLIEGYISTASSHSAGPLQSSNEIAVAFWERVRSHAEEWNNQYSQSSPFASLQPSLRSINSEQDGLQSRTHFVIGYRLPLDFDTHGLQTQLEQWATENNLHLSFSGQETAFRTTRAVPIARALVSAIRATAAQPTFKQKTGTSDMNVVAPTWGNNIVAYGPGDSHLDHTPHEHITITEYIHAIDVLEIALRQVTSPSPIPEEILARPL